MQSRSPTWWLGRYRTTAGRTRCELLARREVVRFLARVDSDDLMSDGRGRAAVTLRDGHPAESISDLSENTHFVGLEDIHPPVKVVAAYEKVVSAQGGPVKSRSSDARVH